MNCATRCLSAVEEICISPSDSCFAAHQRRTLQPPLYSSCPLSVTLHFSHFHVPLLAPLSLFYPGTYYRILFSQPLSDQLHLRQAGPMGNFPCRVHLVFYFLKPSHFFIFHLMSCLFVLTRPLNAILTLNYYRYQAAGNCISLPLLFLTAEDAAALQMAMRSPATVAAVSPR